MILRPISIGIDTELKEKIMGITIIGLVLITLTILPFVGMHMSRKKVENE